MDQMQRRTPVLLGIALLLIFVGGNLGLQYGAAYTIAGPLVGWGILYSLRLHHTKVDFLGCLGMLVWVALILATPHLDRVGRLNVLLLAVTCQATYLGRSKGL